jgi:hypothetical protein
MALATGPSVATYQRLERGEMSNPPLRYLVNCAIVRKVELDEVIEDEWREWYPFDVEPKELPAASRREK